MNRRAFLKAIASVGAVATVPASMLPAWKRREPTIGAINRATYGFWRNQSAPDIGLMSEEALRNAMRSIYETCSSGGNPPGVVWQMK